ncbi:Tagatose 1,6-diphosphate aldolase [Meiothermus luteus]|jgi:tagatose 1,6-diphosphate aldolase|uniref:tagatose-bisphosphate aldolase n=1 Tax=Meiothermus luteus TaxID=2026184 RepID=A0A399F3V0_9DEIN|nr:tagatose 1,6-diphosphate aldolase [Meiothermus luteus]RIH89929.1 Tagatose 1,6-diphosphate aldolase [Meiothermus luteus]RMH57936.1 MAG: tagatose 1,6-diphosphate aldolase [Deinococcota bacterium]
MKLSRGKYQRIQACADERGVIAAAAMDQRGSLRKAIAKAKGAEVSDAELTEFKTAVVKILTPYASAILMDTEYGLPALQHKAPRTGVLLAYEKSGYDTSVPGRLPDLLPELSVRRIQELGGDAVKILLYYNPEDDAKINAIKHAFVERVGAECAALEMPFFLEPIAYDDRLGEGLEMAKAKPRYVAKYMEEFSKDRYGVDVLKVEFPFNIAYTSGTLGFKGEAAYTRAQALQFLKDTASAAGKPFIYLSAGVSDAVFRESLEMAAEAGVPYSGVLCGRATWQDGIPVYAQKGLAALEDWLSDQGVKNIQMLNAVLAKGAKPWWTVYGSPEAALA